MRKHIVIALLMVVPLVAAAGPPTPPPKAKAQARLLTTRAKSRPQIPPTSRYPAVALYDPNLREGLSFRPLDDKGRPRAAAARELTHFLRDRHSGRQHAVAPRLGQIVYEMARHFGRRVEIFSGYRTPEQSERKHSRHLTGSAIDFRVSGVRNESVVAWLRSAYHPIGVGYYPNGVHVHLDVDRSRDTYWVDTGDSPSPNKTDAGLDEATVDEHVTPAPPEVPDPADPLALPDGPDDDPGFIP